jgi:hypothetical protein
MPKRPLADKIFESPRRMDGTIADSLFHSYDGAIKLFF